MFLTIILHNSIFYLNLNLKASYLLYKLSFAIISCRLHVKRIWRNVNMVALSLPSVG